MEAPWGYEGEASEEMNNDHQDSETPKWSINLALPKGITKVFIEEIMLPVDVQVVGQTFGHKVDWGKWPRLCSNLHAQPFYTM